MSSKEITQMNFPDDLLYGPEHEWTRVGADGVVTMGITAFAQDQLGDVEFVDLPAAGTAVERGKPLAEVESTKTASDVFAPCTGTVIERNEALIDDPSLVNDNPYAAWFLRINPAAPAELEQLTDADTYRSRVSG